MPWQQTDLMSERLRFVTAAHKRSCTFTSLCAAFGIAPKTGYKWLRQFQQHGSPGLVDRSRQPKSNSRSLSPALVERVLALRSRHQTWGPRKLVAWLELNEPRWEVPAASTVGELLKRRGLVKHRKRSRYARPRTEPLRHADHPNAVWSMDFKGWFRLGDGTRCDPLTITDAFSRYLLCCEARTAGELLAQRRVWAALECVFREYGLPDAMRVDNGEPWSSPRGELGITSLSAKLTKLGIHVERIDPGKPEQNGRHERFHLTLKQDTASPPESSMARQQLRFDEWQRVYNDERPHEAVNYCPPGSVYVASARKLPKRMPEPEYPRWYEVVVPRRDGRVSWRGRQLFITRALTGERVGLVEIEEGCFEVYFCSLLLGHVHVEHPELGLIAA